MIFKKFLIIFISILALYSSLQANWRNSLGKIIQATAIAGYISYPLKTVYDKQIARNKYAEMATSNLFEAKELHAKIKELVPTRDDVKRREYILNRAKKLGLDSRNLVIRSSHELGADSWFFDDTFFANIHLGCEFERDLSNYINHGEINWAPVTLEHELQHLIHNDSDSRHLFEQTSLLASFIASAGAARNSFAINMQDTLRKSLLKSCKIGSVGLLATLAHYLATKAFWRYGEKRADLGAIENLPNIELIKACRDQLEKNARDRYRKHLAQKNLPERNVNKLLLLEDKFGYLELEHPATLTRLKYIDQAIQKLESAKK